MWQPIGVVVASAIAFGTAAKYRCDVNLPACNAPGLGSGEACCTVSSNMGWRYEVIIIGVITLMVFIVRYFIFSFHESPKFLISKGRDEDAIEVLHQIAKFNKAPMPTLSIEEFEIIDADAELHQRTGIVKKNVVQKVTFMRGLFMDKIQCISFFLLAVAYMVCHQQAHLLLLQTI